MKLQLRGLGALGVPLQLKLWLSSFTGLGSSLVCGGNCHGTSRKPNGKRTIGTFAIEVSYAVARAIKLRASSGKEAMQEFKQTVTNSTGVRTLVSDDDTILAKILATDMRAELQVLILDVIRLGKLAEAPKWHHLEAVFTRIGDIGGSAGPKMSTRRIGREMSKMENLVKATQDLRDAICDLGLLRGKLEKLEKGDATLSGFQRENTLLQLRLAVEQKEMEAEQLKEDSLWNAHIDAVVELLVDVIFHIHRQIVAAFGEEVMFAVEEERQRRKEDTRTLGGCGLALRYTQIVIAIGDMIMFPGSVTQQSRDSLYQMLPHAMKKEVLTRIRALQNEKKQESITDIQSRLDEILDYIVSMAQNTTRYHADLRLEGHSACQLLSTLHHADKKLAQAKLVELLVGLHSLVSHQSRGKQVKTLTESQILDQLNVRLPGLPLLSYQSHLTPSLQLPDPKWAFQLLSQPPTGMRTPVGSAPQVGTSGGVPTWRAETQLGSSTASGPGCGASEPVEGAPGMDTCRPVGCHGGEVRAMSGAELRYGATAAGGADFPCTSGSAALVVSLIGFGTVGSFTLATDHVPREGVRRLGHLDWHVKAHVARSGGQDWDAEWMLREYN